MSSVILYYTGQFKFEVDDIHSRKLDDEKHFKQVNFYSCDMFW